MIGPLDWVNLGIGIGGTLAGVGGFVFAYLARQAARSAEEASREARRAVRHTVTLVDIQRTIDLIQRLKDLHREQRWQAALEHYQPVREMLHDVDALPTVSGHAHDAIHDAIREAIPLLTDLENAVNRSVTEGSQPTDSTVYNNSLNVVQEHLESMRSSMMLEDSETDN